MSQGQQYPLINLRLKRFYIARKVFDMRGKDWNILPHFKLQYSVKDFNKSVI